jgi:hypothetical protein
MGYINNQWLLAASRRQRNRTHGPISATVSANLPTDSWDKEHGVALALTVTRGNGDYQDVLLSAEEIAQLLPLLIQQSNQQVWKDAVLGVLSKLPPQELLVVIKQLVSATSQVK